ncbi:CLUMA_CG017339, isoform A [Clunio marinus]|uniref:CLUMA_CG017339, isoform A n=1 Tax=Clunio marinus TaxID=568069 RepID=A0A1J1IXD8_9DIPT|nr:CLUMA_CG017339, isoform A [Clunio marinus]
MENGDIVYYLLLEIVYCDPIAFSFETLSMAIIVSLLNADVGKVPLTQQKFSQKKIFPHF